MTKEQAGSTRTGIVTGVRRSATGSLLAIVCAAFYLAGAQLVVVPAGADATFSTLLVGFAGMLVGFAGMLVGFAGMTVVAVTMLVQCMAEKRKRRIEQR